MQCIGWVLLLVLVLAFMLNVVVYLHQTTRKKTFVWSLSTSTKYYRTKNQIQSLHITSIRKTNITIITRWEKDLDQKLKGKTVLNLEIQSVRYVTFRVDRSMMDDECEWLNQYTIWMIRRNKIRSEVRNYSFECVLLIHSNAKEYGFQIWIYLTWIPK